jgi:hypothetical protein
MIIKTEVENTVTTEYNSDTIQILKRKFNELTQTKVSPPKVPKVSSPKVSSPKVSSPKVSSPKVPTPKVPKVRRCSQ